MVDEPKARKRIEAKVSQQVPDGVVELDFRLQTSSLQLRQDVCLRVVGSRAHTNEAIARHVVTGKARVVGPGKGCVEDPGHRPSAAGRLSPGRQQQ